jgi:asparagine synthase (glutamine-hydrolysing)
MRAFLAVSLSPRAAQHLRRPVPAALACLGSNESEPAQSDVRDGGWLGFAGPDPQDILDTATGRFTVRLGRAMRTADGDVPTDRLASMIEKGTGLAAIVPPFGGVHREDGASSLVAAGDWLGLRQLYLWRGNGVAAISTSARALAVLTGGGLDPVALGTQAMIGWQIGDGTVFEDVTVLPPATIVTLRDGVATTRQYASSSAAPDTSAPPTLDEAVDEMAEILRTWLSRYVHDHPDSVLQLTGGHDSRILLAAIPQEARKGLQTMTVGDKDVPDVRIAASLSSRYGMPHRVLPLGEDLWPSPAEAHRLAILSSYELDGMASPLALAPLLLAESRLEQGHRFSGLGGEVARGFYYAGNPSTATTSPRLVERLARWRIFANEAVEPEALDPEFYGHARSTTLATLSDLFPPGDWLRATDHFYLFQRMHRWSGTHSSVAAERRFFINPMLDRRFIELALAVAPADKRDSILLGRLTKRLDPTLARIPLDTGLSPARLGSRTALTRVAVATLTGRKVASKVRQRLRRGRRPQLGAEHASTLVLEHWRANPASCAALYDLPLLRREWLDEVLAGSRQVTPTTMAFLVNLVAVAVRP